METIEKIGSQELAEEMYHQAYLGPEWKFLDQGTYRKAFLGPDGFVYKRNLDPDYRTSLGYNQYECKTFIALKSQGALWVPPFTLYQVNNDQDDIMVVPFLRDATYDEMGRWNVETENRKRYREICNLVFDSGETNVGVDPNTELIYLRDGGNGQKRSLYLYK